MTRASNQATKCFLLEDVDGWVQDYGGTSVLRIPWDYRCMSGLQKHSYFGGFRYISGRRGDTHLCCLVQRRRILGLFLAVRLREMLTRG